MPRLVKKKPLWLKIQDVAKAMRKFTPKTLLHECLKRGVITQRMLESWGSAQGEARIKAALKRDISPGVPFAGVIAADRQESFTWTPTDTMSFEEYCAMLRFDMENVGADMKAISKKQRWGANKFRDRYDLTQYEEFSPTWHQHYIDLANREEVEPTGSDDDTGYTQDPDDPDEDNG